MEILGGLGPREKVIVLVDPSSGQEYALPVRELTYADWKAAEWEVPSPAPPLSGYDRNAQPIYHTDDPGYRAAVAQAEMARMYRRLLRALQTPVPGETVEAQVKALAETLPWGVVTALNEALYAWLNEWQARIGVRAESFRTAGTGGAAGVPPERLVDSAGLDDAERR